MVFVYSSGPNESSIELDWRLVENYPKLKDALQKAVEEAKAEATEPSEDDDEIATLDITFEQLTHLTGWLWKQHRFRVSSDSAEDLLVVAKIYDIAALRQEVSSVLLTKPLGLSEFELFIIGKGHDIEELATRNENPVVKGFDQFCENHLEEFVQKCRNNPGSILAKLAKQWKAIPTDEELKKQQTLASENTSLKYRVASFEQEKTNLQNARASRTLVIKRSLMSSDLQSRVTTIAMTALNINPTQGFAKYIKDELDRIYGKDWQCIVGEDFGSETTNLPSYWIWFEIGNQRFVVYKSS